MKANKSLGRHAVGRHLFGGAREGDHDGAPQPTGPAAATGGPAATEAPAADGAVNGAADGSRMLGQRYALGEPLGSGAISEVYRARDTHSGRHVAIKMLRSDLAGDPAAVEQFRQGAQHATALEHPAIVAVHATGHADAAFGGSPYVVTEYVSGRTLRRIMATGGPMTRHHAATVIVDVCAALDFAHRRGIVHGDVKPANVMVDWDGAVKVMDFGVLRSNPGGSDYCSPEQTRGEPVDARTDVYAAGCLLLEMLTGAPRPATDWFGAPAADSPVLEPALDAVLRTATAHRPADRYPTAGAMRAAVLATGLIQRRETPAPDDTAPILPVPRLTDTTAAADGATRPVERVRTHRRRPRARLLALTGLVGIVVGIGLAVLFGGLTGAGREEPAAAQRPAATAAAPRQVAVPGNLTGMQLAAATTELQRLGLQVAPNPAQTPVNDPSLVGAVTAANPPAGSKLAAGSTITLTVGAQPPSATVPDETGKSQQDATTDLQAHGLQVTVQQADGTAPAGTVLSQHPGPQQVSPGSQVTLTVSTGTQPTTSTSPPAPAPPPNGQRGPDGRGTFLCTPDMLSYASCNPDTLGQVVPYPAYDGH